MTPTLRKFNVRVTEVLELAKQLFDVHFNPEDVTVRYDLRGKCAGMAIMHRGQYSLRFNVEAINNHFDDMFDNTIPHEVAHLVCYAKPNLGKDHNAGWKRVCRMLGGDDSRTHSMKLTPAKRVNEFEYVLPSGNKVKLKTIRHNRLQRRQVSAYRYGSTGERITADMWVGQQSKPKRTPSPKSTQKSTKTPSNGLSKKQIAQQILIENPNMSRAQLIELFMVTAGLTKAGASTYYYNLTK